MTPTISVRELQEWGRTSRPTQLIDVRSPGDFAVAHLPGAINFPMDQIESRLQDLAPGSPIVLICQAGQRARIVADLLAPHRENVIVLDGGTNAWIKAGLPVVRAARSRWSLERQVRLGAGLLVLAGVALSLFVNLNWVYLSGLVGAGLVLAGLTDFCPMGILLGIMPWNRAAGGGPQISGAGGAQCSAQRD
ncbi:MAG TPA: rhodanese-like domain-containing protein [Verrucomicrobiae bacterium]|nr:rhodanese-like domain-containing protein [Verrucomicrobiae bacterium]